MMKDVNCPYCGYEQDINHDDGYGYEEGVLHQQQCGECDKIFTFSTSISFDYDVEKADCLNGGEHIWRPQKVYPVQYTKMECEYCGEERQPNEEEWKQINQNQ